MNGAARVNRVKQVAAGRWQPILVSVGGIDGELLDGKKHPCPQCGGKDRFRFINADAGALYCNQCDTRSSVEIRMIDIARETVLSLADAAAKLARRRRGKKPHVSTLYRWAEHGMKGVKLQTVQIGGTRCTSIEALQRFMDHLTGSPRPTLSLKPADEQTAKAQ